MNAHDPYPVPHGFLRVDPSHVRRVAYGERCGCPTCSPPMFVVPTQLDQAEIRFWYYPLHSECIARLFSRDSGNDPYAHRSVREAEYHRRCLGCRADHDFGDEDFDR